MKTINVVAINVEGVITGLRSFENAIHAEVLFVVFLKDQTDLDDAGIEVALDNGYIDVPGGGSIQLVHSCE